MDAGWYRDPTGQHEQRYWDGTTWTDHVSSQGRQTREPIAAGSASTAGAAAQATPAGTAVAAGSTPSVHPPTPPGPAVAPYGAPKKKRRGCLPIALAAVAMLVLIGVVAAVAGSGSDDGDSTASGDGRSSSNSDARSGDDDVSVGDVIENGGNLARVNVVTPNAPALDEFTSPDPGTTFTRLDVEECAGSDALPTNPLYWSAQLDDNTMVDAVLGAQGFQTITLAPGGCQRGTVDVGVPAGKRVTSVVLTDAGLSEVGRWKVEAGAASPATPLRADDPAEAAALGEALDAVGGTAVAHQVTPAAPPLDEFATPDPGETFTRLDVEVCAGSASTPVNPLYWYGQLDDNTIVSAELGAQGLQTLELAPDQCQRGTVDVAVPDGHRVVEVLFTDAGSEEAGRWSVD